MKIIELKNKILQPITNEENCLLSRFGDKSIAKHLLSEREQVLAHQLTAKNILLRVNDGKTIYYARKI